MESIKLEWTESEKIEQFQKYVEETGADFNDFSYLVPGLIKNRSCFRYLRKIH